MCWNYSVSSRDYVVDDRLTSSRHDEEWPRAYVSLKDHAKNRVSEKEIQEWIKQRVSKHKHLVGGVQFVDEVPKLASGKIQRKVMREWAKRDAPGLEARGNVRAKL